MADDTPPAPTEPIPAGDMRQVEEIESLCMNCHADGTTRMLLTHIPFFREVVLMSFFCHECGFKNSEIQNAGQIQQRGLKYTFRASDAKDLERQVVKGDHAVVRIEEIDLEIPAGRGQLTNLEGLLAMVQRDLEAGQASRKEVDETVWEKVGAIISRLAAMSKGRQFPVTFVVDDPSGNSSIEPSPEDRAGKYVRAEYARSAEQNQALGIGEGEGPGAAAASDAPPSTVRPEYKASDAMYPAMPPSANNNNNDNSTPAAGEGEDDDIIEDRVYSFPTPCPGCMKDTTINMKMVRIPHFSEVVIMSTSCEHCGYRSNEVKTGGAVPSKGRVIKLRVENREDLSRDILKAQSAVLEVPELRLNVEPGTMGGRFTTIEGLMVQVRDDLRGSIFEAESDATPAVAGQEMVSFKKGDSMPAPERAQWDHFFGTLDKAINADPSVFPFTVILRDPMAASYVQSFKAPDPDEQIDVEEYERTREEEEDLGIDDINVDDYQGLKDATGGASAPAAAAPAGASDGESGAPDLDGIQAMVQKRMKDLEIEEEKEKGNGS